MSYTETQITAIMMRFTAVATSDATTHQRPLESTPGKDIPTGRDEGRANRMPAHSRIHGDDRRY
ncbi:hypothetical protein BMIN_1057 [Bifidobacterium minimum]|uniref:Uncharacterized protein n=1 Tax=Bifidobacterium minimum TaxID=1693 RepID=A0A087BRH2_9BIFI|nr:hypothetical protein BMIN_1057 [Bifidobacterium minimum]